MKKTISLFLALTLILGIVGCTRDKGVIKTGEELELTTHFFYLRPFDDEWRPFRKAAEITGVRLKGTLADVYGDIQQAFSTMIVSEPLPDIIQYYNQDLNKYGMQGALIPLNDLIDKYAPNIKKTFEERPEVKKAMTAADGNIYSLANIPARQVPRSYFIRKDWLDKLNLPVPKTIDEVYNTLKAFSVTDLNGNGEIDEVAFYLNNAGWLMDISEWFGGRTSWYDENGEVKFGPSEKVYFDTILTLSQWYAEGLIDKEIFTRQSTASEQLLGANRGGMTRGSLPSTATYTDKLRGKYPDFDFAPMSPPEDVNGVVKVTVPRRTIAHSGWGISCDNKHPVETIRYFDFWYSDEGSMLGSFGVEGEHYNMVDGEPFFVDEIVNSGKSLTLTLTPMGLWMTFGYRTDPRIIAKSFEEYGNRYFEQIEREYDETIIENPFPEYLLFTEGENKILADSLTPINTYINEMIQSVVLRGNIKNLTYEQYKKTIDDMGLESATKVYQKAYDRFMH